MTKLIEALKFNGWCGTYIEPTTISSDGRVTRFSKSRHGEVLDWNAVFWCVGKIHISVEEFVKIQEEYSIFWLKIYDPISKELLWERSLDDIKLRTALVSVATY